MKTRAPLVWRAGFCCLGMLGFLGGPLRAQPAAIPEAEALVAPTPARLGALLVAAQRDGWKPHVAGLAAAARRAYERDRLPAAEAWFYLRAWAGLLGQTEADFIPPWIAAVQAAHVAHANMPTRYAAQPRPLAAILPPDLQAWLLGNRECSEEFFSLLSPVDFLPAALEILNQLWTRDPAQFKSHASLALALALVCDVPPPPDWPHGQVPATALARKLPKPTEAFAWWLKQEQRGRLSHRLARLGADELKFVVDTPATFADLEWTQDIVHFPLHQLAKAYTMVRYRTDRAANNNPVWPGNSYALDQILASGGICVDQAYFAAQVGKARGVPTLLFRGAGLDGRHAWFGFLDGDLKWQLDAGRYAEQKFVTGFARDPQTWGDISDHELQFLGERFRQLPAYRQSRVHAMFAADFLAAGDFPAAAVAARKAVSFERRNLAAWQTLLAAGEKLGRDARQLEGVLHEATVAFARYPDLEAQFAHRAAASLRARGETSLADEEERRLATKHRANRSDLSLTQAAETLRRALESQPLDGQIRAYNTLVDTTAHGMGIGFFDQVTVVFARHLQGLGHRAEAVQAVERARRKLDFANGSQLDQETAKFLKELRGK